MDIERFAAELPGLWEDFPRPEAPLGTRFDDIIAGTPSLAEENVRREPVDESPDRVAIQVSVTSASFSAAVPGFATATDPSLGFADEGEEGGEPRAVQDQVAPAGARRRLGPAPRPSTR